MAERAPGNGTVGAYTFADSEEGVGSGESGREEVAGEPMGARSGVTEAAKVVGSVHKASAA